MAMNEPAGALLAAVRAYYAHYLRSACPRCTAARATRADPACPTELARADAVGAWWDIVQSGGPARHPAYFAFPPPGAAPGYPTASAPARSTSGSTSSATW